MIALAKHLQLKEPGVFTTLSQSLLSNQMKRISDGTEFSL